MQTGSSFCFVALFDDDASPLVGKLIQIFFLRSQKPLICKIIDVGLGAVYRETYLLHSQIFKALPYRSQLYIKGKLRQLNNHEISDNERTSIKYMHIRQEIHRLSKFQLINFLKSLYDIKYEHYGSSFMSKAFRIGFETYKYKIPTKIIDEIINLFCNHYHISSKYVSYDRDINATKVSGYCRESTQLTGQLVPDIMIELCYYYYYMLYIAQNTKQIVSKFRRKFGSKSNYFMDYKAVEDNTIDTWNKSLLDPMLIFNERKNSITKFTTNNGDKKDWQHAFGTDLIQLGEKKIWKLKITPFVGNAIVGIIPKKTENDINYTMFSSKSFILKFWNGEFYPDYAGAIVLDGFKKINVWERKETIVTMELDMRFKGKCSLKYFVDDYEWGEAIKKPRQFNDSCEYRLGVAVLEQQTIELSDGYNPCIQQGLQEAKTDAKSVSMTQVVQPQKIQWIWQVLNWNNVDYCFMLLTVLMEGVLSCVFYDIIEPFLYLLVLHCCVISRMVDESISYLKNKLYLSVITRSLEEIETLMGSRWYYHTQKQRGTERRIFFDGTKIIKYINAEEEQRGRMQTARRKMQDMEYSSNIDKYICFIFNNHWLEYKRTGIYPTQSNYYLNKNTFDSYLDLKRNVLKNDANNVFYNEFTSISLQNAKKICSVKNNGIGNQYMNNEEIISLCLYFDFDFDTKLFISQFIDINKDKNWISTTKKNMEYLLWCKMLKQCICKYGSRKQMNQISNFKFGNNNKKMAKINIYDKQLLNQSSFKMSHKIRNRNYSPLHHTRRRWE